jgi:hypothetical protein
LDSPCLPALAMLRVTTAVLELGQQAAAGDKDAARKLSVLATMLEPQAGAGLLVLPPDLSHRE